MKRVGFSPRVAPFAGETVGSFFLGASGQWTDQQLQRVQPPQAWLCRTRLPNLILRLSKAIRKIPRVTMGPSTIPTPVTVLAGTEGKLVVMRLSLWQSTTTRTPKRTAAFMGR